MLGIKQITLEQSYARQEIERQKIDHSELDAICQSCQFTCKEQWKFAGLTGGITGKLYICAPMCPILWKHSPFNTFAAISNPRLKLLKRLLILKLREYNP